LTEPAMKSLVPKSNANGIFFSKLHPEAYLFEPPPTYNGTAARSARGPRASDVPSRARPLPPHVRASGVCRTWADARQADANTRQRTDRFRTRPRRANLHLLGTNAPLGAARLRVRPGDSDNGAVTGGVELTADHSSTDSKAGILWIGGELWFSRVPNHSRPRGRVTSDQR
jgi:hypothetical protein